MQKNNKKQRADVVLNLIIEHYLAEGTPIASKCIADDPKVGASSATVRNVMGQLEKDGFIYSPHTSAGRIPSRKGIRNYVDQLLEDLCHQDKSLPQLSAQLLQAETPQGMCQNASKLMADMTKLTAVVVMPKSADYVIRQLELVRLADKRLLCVLIDEHDQVQNRLVELKRPVSDGVIQQTLLVLNTALAGFKLDEGRERLMYQIKHMDEEVQDLIRLALFGDTVEINEQMVFASGETRLINTEISHDVQKLRQLLRAFEDGAIVNQSLARCHMDDCISVLLADEIQVEELDNCALVAKPFFRGDRPAGALAVFGPMRMDYSAAISAVEMTANILTSALNRQF